MTCDPTFNVRCYGALGDGVTDDTAAIQNCLDAAFDYGIAAVGTGVVVFPPGDYNISDTLTIHRASGTVEGFGVATSPNYNGGNASVIRWAGPDDRPMFKVTDSRWLTFKNLRLAGNDTTPPTYALEFVNEGGSAGSNEFLMVRDVVIGNWPWNFQDWVGGDMVQNGVGFTGNNGNNDQMYLERVQIAADDRGVYLANTQSVWGRFTDVALSGCAVGVETNARTTLTNPMFNRCGLDMKIAAPVLVFGLNSEHTGQLAEIAPHGALVVKGGQFQVLDLTAGVLIDAYPSGSTLLHLDQVQCAQGEFDPALARIRFGPENGVQRGNFEIVVRECRGLHPDMLDSADDYWASVPESQGSVEWTSTRATERFRFRNELRRTGRTLLDFDIWEYE